MGRECVQFASLVLRRRAQPERVADVYLDRKARKHPEKRAAERVDYLEAKRAQLASQRGLSAAERTAVLGVPLPDEVRGEAPVAQGGFIWFPKLGRAFAATAPSDSRYNCIAHAKGVRDSWDFPEAHVQAFDAYYAEAGFYPTPIPDLTQPSPPETVLLYGWTPGSVVRWVVAGFLRGTQAGEPIPCHAVVSRADGTWSSKMGGGRRLRIVNPTQLEGTWYGRIIGAYQKDSEAAS